VAINTAPALAGERLSSERGAGGSRNGPRAHAAADTRASVLPAARAVFSDPALPAWSIETVESAARVTRMTVYNQFGSRAALIEAGIGVTRGAD
jgi:AcrR family transcriptional regulator